MTTTAQHIETATGIITRMIPTTPGRYRDVELCEWILDTDGMWQCVVLVLESGVVDIDSGTEKVWPAQLVSNQLVHANILPMVQIPD